MLKGLYAVPLGIPFLPTLVQELIHQASSDPLALAHHVVILPTRRGCMMLQEAFLKAAPERCRILPRILALSDLEEGEALPGYVPSEILPPAIPSCQRLGLMSQLVLAFQKQTDGGIQSPAGAVRLAQELMRLVDEVETTGLKLTDLKSIVGDHYAAHWQITLDFLKILTESWPNILLQEGYIESAARKRLMLEQIAAHWMPNYPVILAGTTATRPATAKLAQKILSLNKGSVVVAGADRALFMQDGRLHHNQNIPSNHPQYTLTQFIRLLNQSVQWLGGDKAPSSKSVFLSKAMVATLDEEWKVSSDLAEDIMTSLQAIETSSMLEEARQIALIIRYELEAPNKRITLVTPDGELSRRVQAALTRWGIKPNISSGIPLHQSVIGQFLSLSSLLTQDFRASDILALLKHPLCAKGGNRLSHLQLTRQFEIETLRKLQPSIIQTLPFPGHELCAPLLALNDGKHHPFREFLMAHKAVAEALVGTQQQGGESVLWDEEDGQEAQQFIESLLHHAHDYPSLTGRDYPAFLRNLMAQEVVRDVDGIGSRLLIIGTLEARLLESDVVIVAGLNEGTWPGLSEDDPWLSRSMREKFGLPPTMRKIGLAAHDFCTCMTASKVYLTRSVKKDGSPTIASRWWQRLAALLSTGGTSLTRTHSQHPSWATISMELDRPIENALFTPPAPCPPLSARPHRLSVTDVEALLRDPYSIYAKKVLGLLPLNPLDADLAMAERGQAIHQVFDQFVRSGMDPSSPDAMAGLESMGREAFGELLFDPRARAFWWPRFLRLSKWFLNQLQNDQGLINMTRTEIAGEINVPGSKRSIQLCAKADRIEILASGYARIIDYKTGGVPSRKDVTLGVSPQLSLEGLIFKQGGFDQLPVCDVESITYWHVTGGNPPGEVISFENAEELISAAEHGVANLFETFLSGEAPFLACPDPSLVPDYHAYDHLERVREWA